MDNVDRVLRHGIRNYINGMRLNVECLHIVDSPQEQAECLDAISQSADELDKLMDRLLAADLAPSRDA